MLFANNDYEATIDNTLQLQERTGHEQGLHASKLNVVCHAVFYMCNWQRNTGYKMICGTTDIHECTKVAKSST